MRNTLTITDNRTGKQYEVPIMNGTYSDNSSAINAMDLRKIRIADDDFGLLSYDPGYLNTACCKSAITFIDGDRGILRYRGYSIEELASKSTYLEVAYLLIHGELPTQSQSWDWAWNVGHHTFVHENIKKFMEGFRYDAHPMGILAGTVAALSTFYPEASQITDPEVRKRQMYRLIAKMPTIAAYAYRHSIGLPYMYPDNELSYTGNFLSMMFRIAEPKYKPSKALERALDVLFILHADHEQNCSTAAMKNVGSSHADPYVSVASAIACLYGPLHGGANEQVLRMLQEIGNKDRVPEYLNQVRAGAFRLMGFGHRVYKNYDPRAKILKDMANQVFEVTGKNKLLDIALELERIALEDEYFVSRKLYPNVDFYSGIIYQAMGFPVEIFPVLFAIPRTSGWLAQWDEMFEDPEQKLARPRQVYVGVDNRTYLTADKRTER